jgi:hypothetical protein
VDTTLTAALADRERLQNQIEQMKNVADDRYFWMEILSDLRGALLRAEAQTKTNLYTPDNKGKNTDTGVWVETFTPILPDGSAYGANAQPAGGGYNPYSGGGGATPFGGMPGGYGGRNGYMRTPQAPTPAAAAPSTSQIESLSLSFRAIDRDNLTPTANSDLAFAVQRNLMNTTWFSNATFVDKIKTDENTNTFLFQMTVQLRHPLKL